jgi:hypothetical protein
MHLKHIPELEKLKNSELGPQINVKLVTNVQEYEAIPHAERY